jgi:hypothetical protein
MADNKDFTHASGGSLTRNGDGSKRKARWVALSFEIVSDEKKYLKWLKLP